MKNNYFCAYKMQLPVFLFFVLHQFYIGRYFLQPLATSFNITWIKISIKIFFFNGFTQTPLTHPLNDLNPLQKFSVDAPRIYQLS